MQPSVPFPGHLWHGTPKPFGAFLHRNPLTRMNAFWTAPDAAVAAVYAGHDGILLGVVPQPGMCLLDASGGHPGHPPHYLDRDQARFVRAAFRAAGWRRGGVSSHPGDAISFYEDYDEGMCWEGLFQEEGIQPAALQSLLNRVLREFGFDAVLCRDDTEGIEHDVHDRAVRRIAAECGIERMSAAARHAAWSLAIKSRRHAGHRLVKRAMDALEDHAAAVPVVGFLHPEALAVDASRTMTGDEGLRLCLELEGRDGTEATTNSCPSDVTSPGF